MRFYEFKSPTTPADVKKFLDFVKDPNFNPELKKKMLVLLQRLENKLNSPKQESIEADLVKTAEINITPLQRLLQSDPTAKEEFDRLMRQAEDEAFELGAQVGQEQGADRDITAVTNRVDVAIKQLKQLPSEMQDKLKSILLPMMHGSEMDIVLDFLKQCSTPNRLIDLPTIVSKSGNGKLPIDDKYINIAKQLIVNLKSPSSTHASDGPGEWFLVLAGRNTVKNSPGDIKVVGTKDIPVEVKASTIGAKNNISDFTTIKTNVLAARKEFVDTINSFTGNTIFKDAELKAGGISSINTRNIDQLNSIFQDMGENDTRELFMKMFKLAFGKDYDLVSDEVDSILSTITDKGISAKTWIPAMKHLTFSYYQKMYGHSVLFSMNAGNMNYSVSLTAEDFVNSPTVSMTSLFDFRPRMSAITSFKQS